MEVVPEEDGGTLARFLLPFGRPRGRFPVLSGVLLTSEAGRFKLVEDDAAASVPAEGAPFSLRSLR